MLPRKFSLSKKKKVRRGRLGERSGRGRTAQTDRLRVSTCVCPCVAAHTGWICRRRLWEAGAAGEGAWSAVAAAAAAEGGRGCGRVGVCWGGERGPGGRVADQHAQLGQFNGWLDRVGPDHGLWRADAQDDRV